MAGDAPFVLSLGDSPLSLARYMEIVGGSAPEEWTMIHRPTLRHRFTPMLDDKDRLIRQQIDEPLVAFSYKPDIEISLLFGLIEEAAYNLPAGTPFAEENARTVLLDCFHCGQLVHRQTLLKIDRQRCVLPLPDDWLPTPTPIPRRLHDLARLIHRLAGPFTDFDAYFQRAGLTIADKPWP